MDNTKTKKNRVDNVNKKELWSIYDAEINDSQDIKCIYNNDHTLCKLCNSTLAQTEEGYFSCTNNKCGEMYNNIFDFGCEVKSDANDNQRYGMPINPYLEQSSYGCRVNCGNISSYEMRKIKRYTEWQSMPYKEKSQYDEFQRIINMSQNGNISKLIIDDAIRYHKIISEYKTFRGLNRDGIIAASIYISCRINNSPRSAKEIATIFHLDNTSATKGCKNAITIINNIEKDMNNDEKTKLGTTSPESFIERYCSKLASVPPELIKLALYISKIINRDNLIPENTPPAIAAGIIFFIITEFNLNISKRYINQISEISEVTINKCYKKMITFKNKLIPESLLKKYNKT
jgi:transcription initiation factor TFIIB